MPVDKRLVLSVIAGLMVALLSTLTSVATWLSSRSDALWWQLLPWALLAALWTFLIIQVRKGRVRGQGSDRG